MNELRELLFLAHRCPYPPDKGDKIRSWNVLSYLAGRYRVHLACFIDDRHDWQHVEVLKERCDESYFAHLSATETKLRGLAGLFTGAAMTQSCYRNAGLRAWVDDLFRRRRIDCIFVFSSAMAQYADGYSESSIRRVIDFVDVDSDKWRQYAAMKAWPYGWIYRREGRKLLRLERDVAMAFDASLFVSAAEADTFRKLAPEAAHKIFHLRNGVDVAYFSPERACENPYGGEANVLIFAGTMDYWPNVDAVAWFAEEVLPRVRMSVPSAQQFIVGARPSFKVRRLGRRPGITVTGRVPDVRPYLAHAAVSVAPLRVGRGIQNKVLEAMAMAVPVVATPQALEGIEAEVGREVLAPPDAKAFADAVISLLVSGDREAIGRRARARVVADYDWAASLARLEPILEGTASA